MTWQSLEPRVDAAHALRVRFKPVGGLDEELAFIELPAPPMVMMAGSLGVTFQCADGGVYHWGSDSGDPGDVDNWRVRLLAMV